MPTDLAPDPSAIEVVDGAARAPFRSGVLAASIAATGLTTDASYRLVAQVRSQLLREEVDSITAEDLADLTGQTLARFHGEELAARYDAWRRVRRAGRSLVVSVAGTTGVGKSEVANRLAARLGIGRVIATETVRDVLECTSAEGDGPASLAPPYELVELGSERPLGRFLEQAAQVVDTTGQVVANLARRRRSAVLEGPHLVPGLELPEVGPDLLPLPTVLVVSDPDEHRALLEHRRRQDTGRDSEAAIRHFDRVRLVQDHLVEQAHAHDIPVFDAGRPGDLAAHVIEHALEGLP